MSGSVGRPLPRRQRTALVLGFVVALLLAIVATAPTLEHRWQLAHRLWPGLMGPVDPSAPLGYSVKYHQSSDPSRPVTYDPCIVLHVVVNHREAPPQADRMVADAVRSVASATGLPMVLDAGNVPRSVERTLVEGDSDLAPFEQRRDVLIGWATPEEVPGLAGDVLGLGGSSVEFGIPGEDDDYLLDGQVALDAGAFADLAHQADGDEQGRAILLHELGHVVGLDHVDDPQQVMNPTTGALDWGAGARRGLAAMGAGRCRQAGTRTAPWDPGPGT